MKTTFSFLLLFAFSSATIHACDSCAIALTTDASHTGFSLGLTTQMTRLGTLRLDGDKVPNPLDQFLDSSISHLSLGYSNGSRLTWQATLPYVHRSYRRPDGDDIERGTESGLGDATVVAHTVFATGIDATHTRSFGGFLGVKFPTGSAGRIAEELNEDEEGEGEPSGIHGHDLALGSGSTDVVLGLDGHYTAGKVFVDGSAQYALRQEGKYDYRYANELLWRITAGWYAALTHEHSFAIAAVLSGESKGRDTFDGEKAEDTGLHAVYLGARLAGTGSNRWNTHIEIEWPVSQHNTALQAVADHRWRAGATVRF